MGRIFEFKVRVVLLSRLMFRSYDARLCICCCWKRKTRHAQWHSSWPLAPSDDMVVNNLNSIDHVPSIVNTTTVATQVSALVRAAKSKDSSADDRDDGDDGMQWCLQARGLSASSMPATRKRGVATQATSSRGRASEPAQVVVLDNLYTSAKKQKTTNVVHHRILEDLHGVGHYPGRIPSSCASPSPQQTIEDSLRRRIDRNWADLPRTYKTYIEALNKENTGSVQRDKDSAMSSKTDAMIDKIRTLGREPLGGLIYKKQKKDEGIMYRQLSPSEKEEKTLEA